MTDNWNGLDYFEKVNRLATTLDRLVNGGDKLVDARGTTVYWTLAADHLLTALEKFSQEAHDRHLWDKVPFAKAEDLRSISDDLADAARHSNSAGLINGILAAQGFGFRISD